jgi:very-short-patch-repair endonuclease
MTNRLHNLPQLKERRRQLRNSLTPAEALLWKNLQRSQVGCRKFRRQHSVGSYVVDFYCPACRLAVELDGQGHFDSTRSEYDVKRMRFLEQKGICVLRFENRQVQVFESLGEVLTAIQVHLKDSSSTGSPPQ